MILTYIKTVSILIFFYLIVAFEVYSRDKEVLINIIEKSVGKSVYSFYENLESKSLHQSIIEIKAMEDEELQEFGIELKINPDQKKCSTITIIRIRFDLRKVIEDSLQNKVVQSTTNTPEIFKRNGNVIIEYIRLIKIKNNKVVYSRVYDKSTSYNALPTVGINSNGKLKFRK